MPPEVPHYRSLATPHVKFSPPCSPDTPPHLLVASKYLKGANGMKIPGRKIIPLLVIIMSCISIVRLFRITITTQPSAPPLPALLPTLQQACSLTHGCLGAPPDVPESPLIGSIMAVDRSILTEKEVKHLSDLITRKAPCNLLVFGLQQQYVKLVDVNAGGITIFLEDHPVKVSSVNVTTNRTSIYKVEHRAPARKAYQLLKNARITRACRPNSGLMLRNSTCKLALTDLPHEVYKIQWDVIVVDGPSSHAPEAPGRMAAIYTAGVLARGGNTTTEVLVHDADRTIEKWFSWEFLCDENLVFSKGRFWNFRITGKSNTTRFC